MIFGTNESKIAVLIFATLSLSVDSASIFTMRWPFLRFKLSGARPISKSQISFKGMAAPWAFLMRKFSRSYKLFLSAKG